MAKPVDELVRLAGVGASFSVSAVDLSVDEIVRIMGVAAGWADDLPGRPGRPGLRIKVCDAYRLPADALIRIAQAANGCAFFDLAQHSEP